MVNALMDNTVYMYHIVMVSHYQYYLEVKQDFCIVLFLLQVDVLGIVFNFRGRPNMETCQNTLDIQEPVLNENHLNDAY